MDASKRAELTQGIAAVFAGNDDELIDTTADIRKKYGQRIALYAILNPRFFYIQRKYRAFFAGPLAAHIQCAGTMGPLLARDCQITPADVYTCNPTHYYADLFRDDISTLIRQPLHNQTLKIVNRPILKIYDQLNASACCPRPWKRANNSSPQPAFINRESFRARLDALLCTQDGAPDEALRNIFTRAGTGAPHTNYCVAGGAIAKLIDPAQEMTSPNIAQTDIDIFVYGEDQQPTIDDLVAQLFIAGKTYIVPRGGVITIIRPDARDVQIISSTHDTPCAIIASFDIANVMAYWSAGTVYVNACCARAFVTRTARFRSKFIKKTTIAKRIIKCVRAGFRVVLNNGVGARKTITALTTNQDELMSIICAHAAKLPYTSAMTEMQIIARIMTENSNCSVFRTLDVPISSMIFMRREIAGYEARILIEDNDWHRVSLDMLPRIPGMHCALSVSGFKARLFETMGSRLVYNPEENICQLTSASSTHFTEIMAILRQQFARCQLTLQTEFERVGDIVRINADAISRGMHKGFKYMHLLPNSICIEMDVECVGPSAYRLRYTVTLCA